MHNPTSPNDSHALARAALNAASRDPILDGLIGWYAADARHLGAGPGRRVDLDQLLAGAGPDTHLYAGHTAGVLATAGILRAGGQVGVATAAVDDRRVA
ncbi:hypothetical protein [Micromonospora sp. CPCC 206061]|uniref:hypothetical protein n=1 Tax=Micromonospora sp. CPCC 206061 TaxID=3122410 RepID=UPI002FF0BC63